MGASLPNCIGLVDVPVTTPLPVLAIPKAATSVSKPDEVCAQPAADLQAPHAPSLRHLCFRPDPPRLSAGGFAAVERKGMDQAGAIFVRRRSRDGLEALYGPAPQSLVDDAAATDRLFEIRLDRVEAAEVDALIARE